MTELPRAQLVRGAIGPPPRHVPRRLVLRLLFGRRAVVWWIAWMFPIVGMGFALGVQITRTTYSASTTGTITTVEDTGRQDNDHEVYRVSFELVDRAGVRYRGTFETTKHVEPGTQELAYRPENPADARIPTPLRERTRITIIALALAGVGILIVLGEMAKGRAALRLLRYGEPTTGKLVAREEVDDAPDRLTFEYEARGKLRRLVVAADARIEDDEHEPMVFDVKNPDHAVTLDDLPGHPEIREDGSLASRPGLGVHVLVLPAVFVAETLAWLALLVRS
jgi:hypothetical protein